MAGLYTRPEPLQSVPYWDGSTPQAPAFNRWPYHVGDFPRGTTSTSSFIQTAGLRGIGRGFGLGRGRGLGQAEPSTLAATSNLWGYAAAAMLGSALGGAVLGYVAAGDKEGAVRGASFAEGLTGLSDGFYFASVEEYAPAVGFGIAGAVGLGYAIQRLRKRGRR